MSRRFPSAMARPVLAFVGRVLLAVVLAAALLVPAGAQQADPAENQASDADATGRADAEAAAPEPSGQAVRPTRRLGWFVQPKLQVMETVTTNGGYGGVGSTNPDQITDLFADVVVVGRTSWLRVDGELGVRALDYAHHSQPGQVEPTGALNATMELVEKHMFVDAGVVSTQSTQNPFSPAPTAESTVNASTVKGEHVSPDIEGQLGSQTHYRLRSDNGWTQVSPDDPLRSNAYVGKHAVDIERTPTPWGIALNAQREESQFRLATNALTDDTARVILRAAPSAEFTLGARFGVERDNYGLTEDTRHGHIVGIDLTWKPDERTDLGGYAEHRLFGSQWEFHLRERTARLSCELASSRVTTTAPFALFSFGGGASNVYSLLDSIYSGLYPDPLVRAPIVNGLIALEGLPTTLTGPLQVYSQNIAQITNNSLTVAMIGRLSTLAFEVYQFRNDILAANIPSPLNLPSAGSYAVAGGSMTFTRRLTRTTTSSFVVDSSRTTGQGIIANATTLQSRVAMNLTFALSPHVNAVAGAQHRSFRSNYIDSAQESSILAGIAWHL